MEKSRVMRAMMLKGGFNLEYNLAIEKKKKEEIPEQDFSVSLGDERRQSMEIIALQKGGGRKKETAVSLESLDDYVISHDFLNKYSKKE